MRYRTMKLSPSPRERRRRRTTLRLTTDAMLVAIYVVLAVYISYPGKEIQVNFSSLPILLCAYLFGTPDAVAVALCGSFAEQLLSPYGLSPTTPLWMLPVLLLALSAGLLYALFRRIMGSWQAATVVSAVAAELIFTAANTAALYADAHIMGYAVSALMVILPARLLNACVRMVSTTLLSLALLPPLRAVLKYRR